MTFSAVAQNATTKDDGAYKIFWQWNGRGYLTYHADYPTSPQLAGVTLNGYQNMHYALDAEGVQLSWYLYTSEKTGKSYLIEATTGQFITINLDQGVGNGKQCVLSDQVTAQAQLDLKATTNTTGYMLSYGNYNFCSGCGSAKGNDPVRFATDGQTDGGIPFVFVADGASITDEVKNAAIEKIFIFENGFVAPEAGKFYKIKGTHSTNPWLTTTVEGGGIDVAGEEAGAGVYYYNGTSLKAVTGKYIGTNSNNQISLINNAHETTIEDADKGRYYIKTGGRYLYNNQPDYTREAGNLTATGNAEHPKWGFIEVPGLEWADITLELNGTEVGTYSGVANYTEPIVAWGKELTDKNWNGNKFAASVEYPFALDQETMIAIHEDANTHRLYVSGDVVYVKKTPFNYSDINDWVWSVQLCMSDNVISFNIKHVATGKFIKAADSNGHDAKKVTLSDDATAFEVVNNNNFKVLGRASYLSINSDRDDGVSLGLHGSTHFGTRIYFAPVPVATINTTNGTTEYTTLAEAANAVQAGQTLKLLK